MPLPPELDERIRTRFDEIIEAATNLIPEMKAYERDGWKDFIAPSGTNECVIKYYALVEKTSTLLNTMLGDSARGREMAKQLEKRADSPKGSTLEYIVGTLQGLQNDYENSYLDGLEKRIVASVSSDYMTQVDMLLGEGRSAQLGYISAAALCGAVLEDAIRRLCERQSPPISTKKRGGGFKKLTAMIDELQKANVYNPMKRDQLQSFAKIRNSAAHARFNEFTRNDVESMIVGVKHFLADYL